LLKRQIDPVAPLGVVLTHGNADGHSDEAMLINNRVFAPFEFYLTAAVVYFLLCASLSYLLRKVGPKYTLAG
jgi:ABC-type amino acid transport system permease subunit